MKYILVNLSGAADQPAIELGEKTPFELAKIPNLNYFTKLGKLGQVKLSSDRLEPMPDISLLNLLGYDADKVYTGRGPLEAANLELKLEANEVAFRMNFVTEAEGFLADPTGGRISTKEAKALINFLNKKISSDFVRFFPGSEYRHIAVLKDSHGFDALSAKTTNPETMIGEKIDAHLPKGPGEELLKKLMYDAKLLLQNHEINQVRVDLGENPSNMIWLWGQGRWPELERLGDRSGLTGGILADSEYAYGIGRLAGLTVMEFGNGVEEDNARFENAGKALVEALQEKDFVCVHLQACDEASARGDYKAKVSGIESADYFLFSKIKECVEKYKDVRVLITAGHVTPWKTRKQLRDAAPFVLAGKNVMADDFEKFSEAAAKASPLKVAKGSDLIKNFISSQEQKVQVGSKR